MDEKETVIAILTSYDEVDEISGDEKIVLFKMQDKHFALLYNFGNNSNEFPLVFILREDFKNLPHVMRDGLKLDNRTNELYHMICIRESETEVVFLYTFEEMIIDTIERLIHLLSLSAVEKEHEYQKEFMHYWNDFADEKACEFQLYIGHERSFNKMNCYSNGDSVKRVVANGIKLNDKDREINGYKKWVFEPELPFYFIPVHDSRRVIPPTLGSPWTILEIIQIIRGKKISNIEHDTYERIKTESIKAKKVGLVFDFQIDEINISFCCIVSFCDGTIGSLLEKIETAHPQIEVVKSKRCDFYYLCNQIGNDTSIIDKKVLLVGVGSLGSYISTELVKAGIRHITICDPDKLEFGNVLRHTLNSGWVGLHKVRALKYELEEVHPEVIVNAIDKKMSIDILRSERDNFDIVIITVGSSDVQLDLNRELKQNGYDSPVLYVWLEAGGKYSHMLVVNYTQPGCFECLFTNIQGDHINNKVNSQDALGNEKEFIRNGCGGTRAAYGTRVLLRTTNILLEIVRKLLNKQITNNILYNVDSDGHIQTSNNYMESRCRCCGN